MENPQSSKGNEYYLQHTILQYYINYQQDNWTEQLSAAEFQYNNKKYLAIGYTPFELNFE